MADILIRGMAMPENCDKCIYSGWSNFFQIYVCNATRKDDPILFDGKQVKSTAVARSGRADNCPLVEIPEHGDLIDRDALGEFPFNMSFCDGYEADEWVQNAPVIVPASEESKEETE